MGTSPGIPVVSGRPGLAVGLACVLALTLLGGPQAWATREQPQPRDIQEACPPRRVADPGFEDIAGNAHADAIVCAAWWGVAQGQNPTAYVPTAAVRRDQMASFIAGALVVLGVDVPLDARVDFADVDGGNVHAQAIGALAELGVVAGYEDGTYRPDQRVRRDQMASFVSRAAEQALGAPLTDDHQWFADVGEDNPHAAAINGLAAAGIVGGRDAASRSYAPDQVVGRDQMASFLTRTLDLVVAEGKATPPRAVKAELVNPAGEDVGEVTFTERIHGQVEVSASVTGLPEGFHAFHIHDVGACEPDFAAAGDHYRPAGASAHGDHAGDMPVLPVGPDGSGELSFVTDRVSVNVELLGDDGTAVVVHEGPDNYANIPGRYGGPDETTLATGDAGARAACGVLRETALAAPEHRPEPVDQRIPGRGVFGTRLQAELHNAAGEDVGSVGLLPQHEGPTVVEVVVTGLSPDAFHGFHIHAGDSCQPDFAAAGGHLSPGDAAHPNHVGDMPVLLTTEDGAAWLRFPLHRLSHSETATADRRAVIVHAGADNYANIPERYGGPDKTTLASGDAGARRACGVLNPLAVDPAPGELTDE